MKEEPVTVHLTREELRAIIAEGVEDAFVKLGVQVDDPIAMQRDFQHLRDWRVTQETLRVRGRAVFLGLIVTSILSLLWVGFKDALSQRPANALPANTNSSRSQ